MRATALLLAAALAALVLAGSAGTARMGDPDVAALQVALRSHGFQAGTIDGVIGP